MKKRIRRNTSLRCLLSGLGATLLGTFATVGCSNQPLPAFDPPPELRPADKWEAFKALWREVDAIKPAHPEIAPSEGRQFVDMASIKSIWGQLGCSARGLPGYGHHAYCFALGEERATQLRVSLLSLFDVQLESGSSMRRVGKDIASVLAERNASIETQMLVRLLELRIQRMSMANPDFLMGFAFRCRAMPPACLVDFAGVPPSYYMAGAIDRIEARTDALVGLRAKGIVSESVFAAALADIQSDTKLVLFLDVLIKALERGNYDRQGQAEKKDLSKQQRGNTDLRNVQVWERALEASMGRLPQSDVEGNQLENRLAELRAAYPRLEALLAELER